MCYQATISTAKPIDILLVEDDDGDVLLTRKALENGKISNRLIVAKDGVEAMSILRNQDDFTDARRPLMRDTKAIA